jgi:CheY-like chemotaxis protein
MSEASPYPRRPEIIVVDDHDMVLRVVAKMLRKLGFEVWSAASAQEALDRIAVAEPALVLSDIRMPGRSGTELAWHLRLNYPNVRVGLMTAYADATDGERPPDVPVLAKPFLAADLQAFVNRLLPEHANTLDEEPLTEPGTSAS